MIPFDLTLYWGEDRTQNLMHARPHSPFEVSHFSKEIRTTHAIPQVIKAIGKFPRWDVHPNSEQSPIVSTKMVTLGRWQWDLDMHYPSQVMEYLNSILVYVSRNSAKNDSNNKNFKSYD